MIKDLSKKQLIKLNDAAIVTWPVGKKKPNTKHLTDLTGVGALSGAFWGMLFGLIFFIPLLGLVAGAAIGALSGSMPILELMKISSNRFVAKLLKEL